MIKHAVLAAAVGASLMACGGKDASVSDTQTAGASSPTPSPSSSEEADKSSIVESGFGQEDQYAWVMAVVHNASDHAGQTVTVNFNVKDAAGQLIASGSQVSGFNWPGQDLPVATQVDLGKRAKAASVQATMLVEDDGTFEDNVSDAWPTTNGSVYKTDYGSWGAKFEVKNPTTAPLQGAQFMVICHDAAGKIMGGGEDYPELIPASGSTVVDVSSLYTKAKPQSCVGYLHPWM